MKTISPQRYMSQLCFSLILVFIVQLGAQERRYLGNADPDPTLCHLYGLRIKPSYNWQRYWIVGKIPWGQIAGERLVAASVTPGTPTTSAHAYYTMPSNLADGTNAEDFLVENDRIVTTGNMETILPLGNYMTLANIQPDLSVSGTIRRYAKTNYWAYGKSIVYSSSTSYVVASDAYSPGSVGMGTLVTSVNPTTYLVNWQLYINTPGNDTYIKDMIRDASGNLFLVGYQYAFGGQASGVIIRVSQTGTLLSKIAFPMPEGCSLEFNSVSVWREVSPPVYFISGTYKDNTQKRHVFFGTFDGNGVPQRTFAYGVANPYDYAYGSRHVHLITTPNQVSIVIAGKIMSQYGLFYGSLLRLEFSTSESCSNWFNTWKKYASLDVNNDHCHVELNDVTRKIGDNNAVAAVGSAWSRASNRTYILWMDTDANLNSSSDGCLQEDVPVACQSLELTGLNIATITSTDYDIPLPRELARNFAEPAYDCQQTALMKSNSETQVAIKGEQSSISISPTPNNGQLSTVAISLIESDNLTIALYDAAGVKVMDIASQYFKSGKHTLSFDCSTLASGMYALRVQGLSINKSLMLPVVR